MLARVNPETHPRKATRRLPDFLVVGAPRGGTSWLNNSLRAHPAVFMSPRKEPRFFTENLARGVDWYARLFEGAAPDQQAGEASPDYLWRRAGAEIAEVLPDFKAIALLREPVSRAWSHYWMRRTRGLESRSFETIVEAELGGDVDLYLTPGRYTEQLDDLVKYAPATHIHLELFESIRDNPADIYARVCRFLGVDDMVAPGDLDRPVNAQQGFRSVRLRNLSRGLPPMIRKPLGRMNAKPFTAPTIDPDLEERLRDHFAASNEQLRERWIDMGHAWDAQTGVR